MYLYLMELLGKPLYFFILCVAFGDGQRKVDISVNGDHVVKTDFAKYTIYDRNFQHARTLTISCLSFLPLPSTISVLRNGTILNDTFADSIYTNRSNIAITKLTFNRDNVTYLEGAYSCRFNSSLTYNGTQFKYFIEKEVQVNTTTNSQGCASSVGFSGYVGEKVTLFCEDVSYSLHAGFFQEQWLRSQHVTLQVNLLESNATFECIRPGYNIPNTVICSHPFKVNRSLEIEISPKKFTLDSHVMEFSCNSTPPRMLYWELIGDDGNILDLNNNDTLLQAGGNITIKQEAGWSYLNMSTSIMENTDLGIRKVMCYAYGTSICAVAQVEPILETNKTCNVSLCTSLFQTSFPTSESDEETSTMIEMSTHSQSRNTEKEETTDSAQDSVSVQPISQHTPNGKCKNTDWMIREVCILAIASCEALFLLIKAGVWTYHRCRRETKESSSKTQFTGVIVSSETELHENPVYISYDS